MDLAAIGALSRDVVTPIIGRLHTREECSCEKFDAHSANDLLCRRWPQSTIHLRSFTAGHELLMHYDGPVPLDPTHRFHTDTKSPSLLCFSDRLI